MGFLLSWTHISEKSRFLDTALSTKWTQYGWNSFSITDRTVYHHECHLQSKHFWRSRTNLSMYTIPVFIDQLLTKYASCQTRHIYQFSFLVLPFSMPQLLASTLAEVWSPKTPSEWSFRWYTNRKRTREKEANFIPTCYRRESVSRELHSLQLSIRISLRCR